MVRELTALDYAKAACETMIRKFNPAKLPPEGHFHYHQGVFLSGVQNIWHLTNDERYYHFIKNWVDSIIDEEGAINWFDPGQLDDIQPGILLFELYEKSGDKRYKKALDRLITAIEKYPKTAEGAFWHKEMFPQQMWLDGLYMGGPICCEYARAFERPDLFELTVRQVRLMEEKTKDIKSGLWYHAWDETKTEAWADPETGRSAEFWGRSIGWVPIALLDDMSQMQKEHPGRDDLMRVVQELLISLCVYQSDDGRWYQVVDKGGQPGNWLENSCSCLYAAALYRAVDAGILDESYVEAARRGYEGVINSLSWEGEDLLIGNVCIGTGVGDYQFYCDRPVCVNDLHGVGAFLLMCTAAAKYDQNNENRRIIDKK